MATIIDSIEDAYVRACGRPGLRKLNELLFRLGGRGLGLLNYRDGLTGEAAALRSALGRRPRPVVFDVGANVGDWSAELLRGWPSAELHVFEPHPSLADSLRQRLPRARINAVAVGSEIGQAELHNYQDDPTSGHASLLPEVLTTIHHATAVASWSVPVTTLDAYCAAAGLGHIDLLKVDVEGLEYEVLQGAERLFREGRVSALQFEFNEMNTVSRRFLADFAKALPGFTLHRILPHGLLPLENAQPWLREQFVFQNILAVRRAA